MLPRSTIGLVALGYWSQALTNGALRVIVPVYFAAAGLSIAKIAFLFFLFKFAEIFAPFGIGLILNRWGYKRTFVAGLALHTLISTFYMLPGMAFVYTERFVRGLLYMADISAVYVKHFSPKHRQRYLINMILGLKEASKGIGMIAGGVLIGYISIQSTMSIFAALTAMSALMGLSLLPDLKEQVKPKVRQIWTSVDDKIKTLGLGFGLLNGALDAWGVVILPVYLTQVLGMPATFVGTVLMFEYLFQGLIVTFFSKWVDLRRQPRTLLIALGGTLLPVTLALSYVGELYPLLAWVFIYMFFFSISMVYYNHLMIEYASEEKTSIDLATYTTLTNVFKPVGVFVSGLLVESMGFSWAYYFACGLTFLSVTACLRLPKSTLSPARVSASSDDAPIAV